MDKEYLGDGVYVELDSSGGQLLLSTLQGHKIYLEPPEYSKLEAFVDRHWKHPEDYVRGNKG